MFRSIQKQHVQLKQSGSGVDISRVLPAAVTQNILGRHLPFPDILSMCQTSKKLNGFFQVQMDTLKILKYVVEGDVDALVALIQDNPGLLFKKGTINAPRGQTYYNVSPYMLIKFLCDKDMLAKIMPLIPEHFNQVCDAQDVELGRGGCDLVKLNFDPMSVINDDFNKICAFKTSVNVERRPIEITFPLLENPDGLLYWKDAYGEVRFYYAHRETQTVIPIIPVATTPEEHKALDAFKDSFDEMENNSARRSTNKEHQLITKLMRHALHRQGIRYSNVQGESYCDSHTPFQLINRYRTCIRRYQEAESNDEWTKRAHRSWREGIGHAQGEEMWLLQRICEWNRPFDVLPQNFDKFKRGLTFYNFITRECVSVFNGGRFVQGLGSDFALYKSGMRAIPVGNGEGTWAAADLIALCRLVEEAKTIGLALESDQVVRPNFGP